MSLCPHDMNPADCGDCRPRPGVVIMKPGPFLHEYGPWFIAAYNGTCAGCGEDVGPGDEIRADGHGGWEGRCCDLDGDR